MPSHPAQAVDLIPASPSQIEAPVFSALEASERVRLREAMRLRRSVDHFARAWYGGILSLILTGISTKLFLDAARAPAGGGGLWVRFLMAGLAVFGWCFATVFFVRSRHVAHAEHTMLVRLQDLDERSPKPPELF